MIGLKSLKIGSKAILLSTVLFTVVLSIISISIAYQVEKIAEEMAELTVEQTVERYTNALHSSIIEPMSRIHVLGKNFQTLLNHKEFDIDEPRVDLMLKEFIRQHPEYLGVWLVVDVNEQAKAEEQAWRFNSYWVLDEQKQAQKEQTVSLNSIKTGEYYQQPKRTRKLTITNPFLYPIQGQDVLMTTIATPLFTQSNEFNGVASIDIELQALAKQLKQYQNLEFKNASIDFYSADGTLVSGQYAKLIGKNIKELESPEFAAHVLEHEKFSTVRFSEKLNENIISYVVPVKLHSDTQQWMIAVHIPEHELYAMSRQALGLISISGLLGVILIIIAMYFFVKSFMSPLLKMNRQLNALALGKVVTEEDIEYHAKDEIAESVNYTRKLKSSMNNTIQVANTIASGDYTKEVTLLSDEDQLGRAIANMTASLREAMTKTQVQDWLKSGQAQLSAEISGEQDIVHLAEKIINFLVPYLESQVGVFYIYAESLKVEHTDEQTEEVEEDSKLQGVLRILATHAYVIRKHFENEFHVGEGIVGQAALERRLFIVTDVPPGYIPVQSGLGEVSPSSVLVMPLLHENELKGVLEIASLHAFSETQIEFLKQIESTIATAVHTAEARTKVQKLLEQSQRQAHELREQSTILKTQQQELQQTNEELQAQSEELPSPAGRTASGQ